MKKFKKLVSIDKVALTETGIRELQNYAESIELAQDIRRTMRKSFSASVMQMRYFCLQIHVSKPMS